MTSPPILYTFLLCFLCSVEQQKRAAAATAAVAVAGNTNANANGVVYASPARVTSVCSSVSNQSSAAPLPSKLDNVPFLLPPPPSCASNHHATWYDDLLLETLHPDDRDAAFDNEMDPDEQLADDCEEYWSIDYEVRAVPSSTPHCSFFVAFANFLITCSVGYASASSAQFSCLLLKKLLLFKLGMLLKRFCSVVNCKAPLSLFLFLTHCIALITAVESLVLPDADSRWTHFTSKQVHSTVRLSSE